MTKIGYSELQEFNPWKISASLINEDRKILEFNEARYKYIHPLVETFPINKDCILTLRGPRRIGKTTVLKLLIKKLLIKEKISANQIFYYSLDEIKDFTELDEVLRFIVEVGREKARGKRLYFFLDEISFVKEWQRAIKQLADLDRFQNTTILLTGSSSVDLLFSSEQMPGRRGNVIQNDFIYYPCGFFDFVKMVQPKLKTEGYSPKLLSKLRGLFSDYLICGGFPEIINDYYKNGFVREIYYKIFTQWVDGDIYKLQRNGNTAFRLMDGLLKHETTPISYYELTKEAELSSHATTIDYLDILEKMFVIYKAEYFNLDQKKRESKKNKKIYFLDPFIRTAIEAKISANLDNAFNIALKNADKIKAILVEEICGSSLLRKTDTLYYGKTGEKEIDFVAFSNNKYEYFEVRYANKVAESDFSFFQKAFPNKKLTVITKNDYFSSKNINFIPLELFLLVLLP